MFLGGLIELGNISRMEILVRVFFFIVSDVDHDFIIMCPVKKVLEPGHHLFTDELGAIFYSGLYIFFFLGQTGFILDGKCMRAG